MIQLYFHNFVKKNLIFDVIVLLFQYSNIYFSLISSIQFQENHLQHLFNRFQRINNSHSINTFVQNYLERIFKLFLHFSYQSSEFFYQYLNSHSNILSEICKYIFSLSEDNLFNFLKCLSNWIPNLNLESKINFWNEMIQIEFLFNPSIYDQNNFSSIYLKIIQILITKDCTFEGNFELNTSLSFTNEIIFPFLVLFQQKYFKIFHLDTSGSYLISFLIV